MVYEVGNFKDTIDIVYRLWAIGILAAGVIWRIIYLEVQIRKIKKLFYLEEGGLNIINVTACKAHRDIIHTSIREAKAVADVLTTEMRTLNENVLKIMFHLKIEK